LRLVLNKGIPSENIVATEFSQAGVKAINLLGIKCFNKDLKSISSEDISGKVNVICLFQVLEHLSDIHNFFLKINEFTNPGARLYISVPNYYQRRFYDTFNLNYDLPPIHVGRYNANSLGVLAMAYGWKILQNRIQPSTYAERVKKFLFSRFDNWQRYWATEKLGIKFLRLFLRYSLYLLITLVYIRLIAGLKRADLGTAQWFELERIK
jgi:SAM-dependent methyltransferase